VSTQATSKELQIKQANLLGILKQKPKKRLGSRRHKSKRKKDKTKNQITEANESQEEEIGSIQLKEPTAV
jgi:tubulin polyglutamylase TTLL4